MNKIYIIPYIILFVVLSSFSFAEVQTLGTFKINECIDLIQTCDNCTYINFSSVVYPDGTFEILDLNSTNQGTTFNQTFCNTSQIGAYIINTVGDLNGVKTSGNYNLYINPSGIVGNDNTVGIIVPIFSILINLIILFLGFKQVLLKNELSNFILRRSLLVLGIWLLVLNSSIMATIASYAGLDLNKEMFMFMEWFGWTGYIAMIILVFTSIIQFMKAWKIKKTNQRNGGDYD